MDEKKKKVGMDGEDGCYMLNPSDFKGFDGDDGCYLLNPSDFKGFDGDDGCDLLNPSDFKGFDGDDGCDLLNPSDFKGFDGDDGCYLLNTSDFKGFDGDDGCYVINPSDFKGKKSLPALEDIAIIAEKGPVPLRDYPHPRHLCLSFPFHSTPHQSYCTKCYCYVCETRAPCLLWLESQGHCHVTDVSKADTVYNSIQE